MSPSTQPQEGLRERMKQELDYWIERAEEFEEVLSDLVALRLEHWALNGGGPGWKDREKKAWDRAEELVRREE